MTSEICGNCKGVTPPPGMFCQVCGASTPRARPTVAPSTDKRAYVKSQGQTRSHHCHWPGCTKQVPPAMWGCKAHWFRLPKELRDKVWKTYEPGQEVDGSPSGAYLAVADEVQAWIRTYGGAP